MKKKTIKQITKEVVNKIPTDAQLDAKEKEMKKTPEEETITITKTQFDDIQSKLKMLTEVADKGRVFNYENQQAGAQKKSMKVKLSEYTGGIITGWRTIKDVLVKHPQTGATVGEQQQYELLILMPDGHIEKVILDGYSAFSGARYDNRIDAIVISKSEDFQGNTEFELQLDGGRVIKMSSRFVN